MNKIGILTTSHAINYGAVLQAFSLKKRIEEITLKEVEIINYCGDEWIAGRKVFRRNTELKNLLINFMSLLRIQYRNNREELVEQFDAFKRDYLDIQGKIIHSSEELKGLQGFDTLICGSDQVWNMNLFNDPAYFLTFADRNTDKIAYAASISDNMSKEQMKIIAERVKDFKAISVREQDDAQRLSEVLGRTVEAMIDPVFFHSADKWRLMLSIKDNNTSKYLFVFLISHQEQDQRTIEKVKGNRKVKVLNLHPINYIKGDEVINCCNPCEFVKMIANADAIITDSFHCTAFSIIFNKVFYNIKRPTRNNRIENLYQKLGIESRFISGNQIPKRNIVYKDVNDALLNEIHKGEKYIKESIGK